MLRKLPLLAALGVALLGCEAAPSRMAPEPAAASRSQSGLEVMPLQLRSGADTYPFQVEVARTPDEQAQGLMVRERLGPNEGMLFPFDPPRPGHPREYA